MAEKKKFGLIGTITYDVISYEGGKSFQGLGGILYQAAVLCGLGDEVHLFTNLGEGLVPEVERVIHPWRTLKRQGLSAVPGPGNRVFLFYPGEGERKEILKSCVPPLKPEKVMEKLPELDMLVLVINSGFDIEFREWRKIVRHASCPIWFDIHSLALSKEVGIPRKYCSLREWCRWAEGVDYLQANRQEVASMLGKPEIIPSAEDLESFANQALALGIRAVFITLGSEGLLLAEPGGLRKIAVLASEVVVDTTGCGDVFCAAVLAKLARGFSPYQAASSGIGLASRAVSISGVEETFFLARNLKNTLLRKKISVLK